jgi:hypothetical protein
MGLLEDLSSGKYNLILIGIIFIFIFHQYWCVSRFSRSMRQNRCKEQMTNVSNDINAAISRIYKADVEAIRNLADLSKKIQDGGLTIPGNLIVKGTIKSDGDISNNSSSFSGLNSRIDSVNSQLSSSLNSSIQSLNSNVSSQISSLNSQLSNKFDKSGGTISGDVNITGYLTGTNFTMNTGGGNRIQTLGNQGQFLANGSIYFGSGACHGDRGRFGSCR